MSIRSITVAAAQRRAEDRKTILSIVNPIPGSSGIYNIIDDAGNTFPAYVDMSIDGGYWILVARWTGWLSSAVPASRLRFKQTIVKNQAIAGFSVTPGPNPAIPAGRISSNPSKEWLLRSSNAAWTSLFGQWQKGQILEGNIAHGVGVPVVTSIGPKTLHGHRTGWFESTSIENSLGFWTAAGNGGHCGGAGREGTNKCCPIMAFSSEGLGSHADGTGSVKQMYLRATNYPG